MSYVFTIALVPLAGMLLVRGRKPGTRTRPLGCAVLRVSLPVACACVQLELVNMHRTGELTRLLNVAKQTDLTFNLVSSWYCRAVTPCAARNLPGGWRV